MKCPECGHNHLRGKGGMTCSKCRYEFILDPKRWMVNGNSITDGRFLKVLRKATADGTRYITEDELYTHALRNLKAGFGHWIFFPIFFTLLGVFIYFGFKEFLVFGIFASIMLIVGIFAFLHANSGLPRGRWDKIVRTWKKRQAIPGLIEGPSLHEPPPDWKEPDIYEYGAERLIVCERDILVDWLVRNEFHLKERALIISESGYPNYLLEPTQRLLQNNPQLPTFLLHDASASGAAMNERILNSTILPVGNHPITDLGIHRKNVDQFRLPRYMRKHESDLPVDGLTYAAFTGLAAMCLMDQIALGAAAQSMMASESGWGFEVEVDAGDFG